VPDGTLLERFIRQGDQDAFAALMQRHGPYVLGVCRRVTFHAQDAEDVFQACFLELVRRARTITRLGSVAGWLQTVAARLARKARVRRARREQKEGAAAMVDATVQPNDVTWREVRLALEEEMAALPEELRAPLILCLFQGRTQEEAARQLGINPRTVKDRLRRGRARLRQRLTRRGITLGVLGALLAGGNAQAAVPATLQQVTLQGAAAVAAKAPLAGVVAPAVLTLTSASPLVGWGLAAVAVLVLALSGGGAYLAWERPEPPPPPPAPVVPVPAKPKVHHRSFRGGALDDELFQYIGRDAERYLRREAEGLRITLPPKDGPAQPVGLMVRYPVRGDFELEATFEYLDVPLPAAGYGAGANLWVWLERPQRDGVLVGKLQVPAAGLIFLANHRINADGERINQKYHGFSAERPQGLFRLRMARAGTRFTLSAGEGEAGELRVVDEFEVSDADVSVMRLAGDPGWSPEVAVDVRLIEMSLKAQQIVGYEP
jgi:RNA polymerase sigma factor (sigma-70 family)